MEVLPKIGPSCFRNSVTAQVDSVDDSLKKDCLSRREHRCTEAGDTGVGYQAQIRDPEGNVIGIL